MAVGAFTLYTAVMKQKMSPWCAWDGPPNSRILSGGESGRATRLQLCGRRNAVVDGRSPQTPGLDPLCLCAPPFRTRRVVFPSLTLFSQLRFPVMFFPRVLSMCADAQVSLARLQKFLQLPETEAAARRPLPTLHVPVLCGAGCRQLSTAASPAK